MLDDISLRRRRTRPPPLSWKQLLDAHDAVERILRGVLQVPRLPREARIQIEAALAKHLVPCLVRTGRRSSDAGGRR
jgi:hypothetical protein